MRDLSIESFTDNVINSMGPKTPPRVREVMTALIRHLHDFAREVNLTTEEWLLGVEVLNRTGRMSDEKRNEMILMSDVVGLESLVDALDHRSQGQETESAVLGPFYRENAPKLPLGATVVQGGKPGESVLVNGRIASSDGTPIAGAVIDVWETAPNGLYEQQDPDQPDMNLRGRFETAADGSYAFRCVRPVSYPVPFDGPAGELLRLMDRHAFRPAHLHMIVSAPGHQTLVTQIFDRTDKYLDSDAVFAVKDSLVVDFKPAREGMGTKYVVDHDIRLKAEPARHRSAA